MINGMTKNRYAIKTQATRLLRNDHTHVKRNNNKNIKKIQKMFLFLLFMLLLKIVIIFFYFYYNLYITSTEGINNFMCIVYSEQT